LSRDICIYHYQSKRSSPIKIDASWNDLFKTMERREILGFINAFDGVDFLSASKHQKLQHELLVYCSRRKEKRGKIFLENASFYYETAGAVKIVRDNGLSVDSIRIDFAETDMEFLVSKISFDGQDSNYTETRGSLDLFDLEVSGSFIYLSCINNRLYKMNTKNNRVEELNLFGQELYSFNKSFSGYTIYDGNENLIIVNSISNKILSIEYNIYTILDNGSILYQTREKDSLVEIQLRDNSCHVVRSEFIDPEEVLELAFFDSVYISQNSNEIFIIEWKSNKLIKRLSLSKYGINISNLWFVNFYKDINLLSIQTFQGDSLFVFDIENDKLVHSSKHDYLMRVSSDEFIRITRNPKNQKCDFYRCTYHDGVFANDSVLFNDIFSVSFNSSNNSIFSFNSFNSLLTSFNVFSLFG
jgi:hypothetical protein